MSEPEMLLFDNSDPLMQLSYQKARGTFRYFWREIAWERRRIVPALDLACVKAPFSDGGPKTGDSPQVEHMWLSEVDFDGEFVSGVLGNSLNWALIRNDIEAMFGKANAEEKLLPLSA